MSKTYININGDMRDASSVKVPADRTFRGAWQFEGDAIEVSMDAAKEIHKDVLRAERAPLLAALDVDLMKALELGESTAAVAASKNALRGVTADPRIEAAATPEELKALSIAVLVGE